ncbi:hypothetical protein ACN6LM_001338 [Streptomyces sp. SAS_281]
MRADAGALGNVTDLNTARDPCSSTGQATEAVQAAADCACGS